jgi:hypothetical protein
MSIKANILKSSDAQKKAIAKEVTLILAHLDDELKIAHEQGKHFVAASVPITFSIPYMSNTDAQRIIYYKVLTSLLDREFNVKVQLEDTATIFHVRWLSDDEEKDIELQHSLLAKHTINKRKS